MDNYNYNYITLKIINPIIKLIKDYYNNKEYFFKLLISIASNSKFFCENKRFSEYGIYFLICFFVITVLWLFYDLFINVYKYYQLSIFFYFKQDKRLVDSPLFAQIKNLWYVNDYFSIDFMFILFLSTPFFILIKLYVFEKITGITTSFNSTKILNYAILIIGFIYFLIVYKNLANLGARVNMINALVYNNINVDFIHSEKFCNYLLKKSVYDYDFKYGKCNDLSRNISISKLFNYIKKQVIDIGQRIAPISNITIDNFKTLKDKNGVYYKDKIISAFFTYQLIKYYIDNDLEDEAKDFFSTFNLLYLKNTGNFLRTRINPILYLRHDHIIINERLLEYDNNMENSFNGNKDIYNYIYKEYNSIQTNVQNIVVDIYNICSYKLISVYVYYIIIFIIFILLIIYYIYNRNV
jgi:hypothetical protein